MSVLASIREIMLNIVNIYAPNVVSDQKSFFSCLHHYFISQGKLIVSGDFNCVDSTSDKLHSDSVHSSEKASLSFFET